MKLLTVACVLLAMTIAFSTMVLNWPSKMLAAGYAFIQNPNSLAYMQETLTDFDWYQDSTGNAVVLEHRDGTRRMLHDGYPSLVFDTHGLSTMNEKLIGASAAALLSEDHRNEAIVLGFGTGISASVVTEAFASVQVFELRPSVLQVARNNFSEQNRGVLDNANNMDIKLQDGIVGIARTNRKVDAIYINVPSPGIRGAEPVFAVETLELIASRVKPHGKVFVWIHAGLGDEVVKVMLRNYRDTIGPCRYFVLKETYLQGVCAPHMTESEFLAEPISNVGVTGLGGVDLGEVVKFSEAYLKEGYIGEGRYSSYDKPYFDTRALMGAVYGKENSANIPGNFSLRYPGRYCEYLVAINLRQAAHRMCQ